MRKLFFILLISLQQFMSAQNNIAGFYMPEYHSHDFDIKPDHTYIYNWHSPCGVTPSFSNKGTWRNVNDTLYLSPEKDTLQLKFIRNYAFSFFSNGKVLYDTIELMEFPESGSIIPHQFKSFLDVLNFLPANRYQKSKSYYDNGLIEYTKETDRHSKRRVECYYYSTGQLKEVRQFRKDKRSGDWYFYTEDGYLQKLYRYRRGHLRKKIINYD
ncbi:MAG: hypothetical protein ACJ77K_04345 [Bacteroidia bacterium]|jgi:antitoxin component YwqK of YwqJK toxin-antitoxin module